MIRLSRFLTAAMALRVTTVVAGDVAWTGVASPLAGRQPDALPSPTLGRPTDSRIAISLLASDSQDGYVEYGTTHGAYDRKSSVIRLVAGQPLEVELTGLAPNTAYVYRVRSRRTASSPFAASGEFSFRTQRTPGATFHFDVQGDSHPERLGKMFEPELYRRTLGHVQSDAPDFYMMLGDDFSIERLIAQQHLNPASVYAVYARQREFLSAVARSSPLYLVNGNHEEAARFLLDGTPNSAAALAGRARTMFFPLPAPDGFYSGDTEQVEHVGLLRDYYAWTWGDALFVVLDPYWHSKVPVDAGGEGGGGGGGGGGGRRAGGGGGARGGNAQRAAGVGRNLWDVTIGDEQYAWLTRTLESSTAKYKFVFAHHVMGTGRGAVEVADGYEWGGRDRRGTDAFRTQRPTWSLPIHQLFVKTGVTIFFQGHDHLFAQQEKDGVIYQEVPNPADATYQAFNRDAYRSGVTLPNSGHVRVTVGPDSVRVAYIRSFLSKDETADQRDGMIAHAYAVAPKRAPR